MDDGEFDGYHFNNHLNPFRCLLLSEKRCQFLFIRLLTGPGREEVHCQTIQMIKWDWDKAVHSTQEKENPKDLFLSFETILV